MIISSIKATMIHQRTTKTGSRSGLEYRTSGSMQRANTTGSVGCGSDHLLDVLNNEVQVFLLSNQIEVRTKVLNKSNLFHGGG